MGEEAFGCCGEILTLTETGCQCSPLPPWEFPEKGFSEESLHCHYRIAKREDSVVFTLWRTKEDLQNLSEEAENLGMIGTIGLFFGCGIAIGQSTTKAMKKLSLASYALSRKIKISP